MLVVIARKSLEVAWTRVAGSALTVWILFALACEVASVAFKILILKRGAKATMKQASTILQMWAIRDVGDLTDEVEET